MSEFNHFAKELNQIAQAAFAEYRKAEKDYQTAKQTFEVIPAGSNDPAALIARGNYLSARDELQATQRRMADRLHDVKKLRSELAQAVDDAFAARPEDLDGNTLRLLESGILTAGEFQRLMDTANNSTMRRIISQYAQSAADAREAKHGASDETTKLLREVSYRGQQNPGDSILGNFDALTDAFARSTKNPGLIDHWNELCGGTIENF